MVLFSSGGTKYYRRYNCLNLVNFDLECWILYLIYLGILKTTEAENFVEYFSWYVSQVGQILGVLVGKLRRKFILNFTLLFFTFINEFSD